MMFVVIVANVLGFAVAASIQSIISSAADADDAGPDDGRGERRCNSLMAVLAPVLGAPLLGIVSHLPHGDWRIGAPFYFCAAAAGAPRSASPGCTSARPARRRPPRRRAPPERTDAHARQDPDPRLRLPGHAADRAPRARGARLLRDPSERRQRRLHPRVRAEGNHPVGQPRPHLRGARAARAAGGVASSACRCSASATACSRWRCSSAARSRRARIASSATPRCARTATRGCSTASRTSRPTEGHGMLKVWMSHGDKVTALPPGFTLMASTPSCPIAGMADEARGYYGVQFHPEVTHTRARAASCSSASCSRSAARGPTG